MLNPIQIAAIKTSLRHMFNRGSFSICTIDNVLKLTGGIPKGDDYKTLSLLHCVNYQDMPPELLEALPNMVKNIVESQAFQIDDMFMKDIRGPKELKRIG
jgi:hypothetical protein